MVDYTFLILGLFVITYLEVFFARLNLMSLIAVLSIFAFKRISTIKYTIFFVLIGIIIDTIFHLYLGSTVLAVVVGVSIYSSLGRFLPASEIYSNIFIIFLSFLGFHFAFHLFANVQNSGQLGFTSRDFGLILKFSFIELGLYAFLDFIVKNFPGKTPDGFKLKK